MVTWKKTLLGMAVLYLMGAAFIAFPTVDLATNDVPGAEGKTVNKLPPAIAPPPTVRTMPKAVLAALTTTGLWPSVASSFSAQRWLSHFSYVAKSNQAN